MLITQTETYQYPKASEPIEQYLLCVKNKLLNTPLNKNANDANYILNRNFQRKVLSVCKSFMRDKDVIVKASDKNLGLCVIPRVWYVNQALNLLNTAGSYERVHVLPTVREVFDKLRIALQAHGITVLDKVGNYLYFVGDKSEDDLILAAAFYLLIKVHKSPISVRPIASCFGTVCRNASKYVHVVLTPLMNNIPSILRNSVDLLRHLALVSFPRDCVLLSADVVNLYPSIPIVEGVLFVGEAIDEYNKSLPEGNDKIDKVFILVVLHWILTNNYVGFDGDCWRQTQGTAMGTPCAVVYANIYLYIVEKKTMKLMRETLCWMGAFNMFLLYVRYIDDIFAVCENIEFALAFVKIFNSISPTVQLTCELVTENSKVKTLPYLDVEISKGVLFKKCGLLDVCLYQKPLNAYLYIPVFSNHSENVYKSIIVSELRRFTLCCSNPTDLTRVRDLYETRLKARGYPEALIVECFKTHFVRNEVLFPPRVRAAYRARSTFLPPYDCVFYSFKLPSLKKATQVAPLVFAIPKNTPRFTDNYLREVLSFKNSGSDVMCEYDFIVQGRSAPMIAKKPLLK